MRARDADAENPRVARREGRSWATILSHSIRRLRVVVVCAHDAVERLQTGSNTRRGQDGDVLLHVEATRAERRRDLLGRRVAGVVLDHLGAEQAGVVRLLRPVDVREGDVCRTS